MRQAKNRSNKTIGPLSPGLFCSLPLFSLFVLVKKVPLSLFGWATQLAFKIGCDLRNEAQDELGHSWELLFYAFSGSEAGSAYPCLC